MTAPKAFAGLSRPQRKGNPSSGLVRAASGYRMDFGRGSHHWTSKEATCRHLQPSIS
nr:unknown protein 2 [Homo sapiens]